MLQRERIAFTSCLARHRDGRVVIEELVVATVEDLAKAEVWAEREGYPIDVLRVATEDEIRESRDRF